MIHKIREQIQDLTCIIEEAHSAGLPRSVVYHHREKRNQLRSQLRRLIWNTK